MMGYKKLISGVFTILLITSFFTFVTSVHSASGANIDRIQKNSQLNLLPLWEQVNSNGFGNPQELEVSALETFNNYLYAGTYNLVDPLVTFDGARIFRSPDGTTWTAVTEPGFQNPHDSAPPAILDFVVFNTRLYASTGRGGNPAQIWRSSNGVNWAPMVTAGFGDQDIHDIPALAVFNGMIYAGAGSQVSGAKIYRSSSGDSNTWTLLAPAASTMAGASITGFAVYSGALWATVESEAPVQLWRSTNGSTWTSMMNNGFGDSNTTQTGGMAVFGGSLYVGAGNAVSGAQLWRTSNGTSWTQAISPGFGDANNQKVEAVFVFQNQLYASVKNTVTGMEVWRSADGAFWEQVNQDGFGDSKNTGSNRSSAAAEFLSQLYTGTSNVTDGGELWRMLQASTATPTSTATNTPTDTPTSTATGTVTNTPSFTATNTATDTPTASASATATDTPSFTPTSTATYTPTDTPTFTATNTATDTPTFTPTSTATYTPTDTPTFTATNTATNTLTFTPTSTATYTPTDTPTYTATYTATSTPTYTPTSTSTPLPNSPGKVTGGGNFERVNWKVTFGFVVQYNAGAASPSGNLTFVDHARKLTLKAASFTLLYIKGNHARITGLADINGVPNVPFTLDVLDYGKPGLADGFLMQIPSLNGYSVGGRISRGSIHISVP